MSDPGQGSSIPPGSGLGQYGGYQYPARQFGPQPYQGSAAPNGMVRVHRDHSLASAVFAFVVWIDDIRVDWLRSGQETAIALPPGVHHVQVRWAPAWSSFGAGNSETFSFLVEPGQVVHFRCRYAPELFCDKIQLRRLEDLSHLEPGPRVLGVTETTRIEESLDEKVQVIDNRDGPAPVASSFKASRQWTLTLTLDESRSQILGFDAGARLLCLSAMGNIKAEVQHSISEEIGSTHLFEEEISITVPERTAVRITLAWKRIWQCGDAHVLFSDGSMRIVPYQVVVSVTLDQKIQEITAPGNTDNPVQVT